MRFERFQNDFARALTAPNAKSDFFANARDNRRAMAIYRNNVAYSLRESLMADFPVVRQLLGETLFKTLALEFLRNSLPQKRCLTDYGDELADFIHNHSALAQYPWLSDVARIEICHRQVFHAQDEKVVNAYDLNVLQSAKNVDFSQWRFRLRSCVQILTLEWTADVIWHAHQKHDIKDSGDIAIGDILVEKDETHLIISRLYESITMERLDVAMALFLKRLDYGLTLERASNEVLALHPDFDLTSCLAQALSQSYFQA